RVQSVAFEILTIRNQYEDPVASRMATKRRARGQNGARDVGAAQRNRMNVDRVQRLVEGTIVECQRTHEEGAPRECNDADSVAIQLPRHVIDRELGARQPIGFDIRSQHTARRIDREHDLVAATADLLPVITDLRAGESREKKQYGCK